ncbi:MAG TPA: hypothetical protein HA362_07485 [Nanoarchaeota archaeon]|nr:hypothetical protein [Nanoarchaeota archaeon]
MKTKPAKLEKKSRKKLYIGLLGIMIIAIMVGSALDLWKSEDGEGAYEYKGLTFAQTDAGWIAFKPDGTQILIMTNPAELANLTVPYVNIDKLNAYSKVYVAFNPKERVRTAMNEFFRFIDVQPLTVPACTEDNEQCADMPIKDCKDAGSGVGVLLFREANQTEISFNNDCLVIQGKDLTKVVDKIVMERIA